MTERVKIKCDDCKFVEDCVDYGWEGCKKFTPTQKKRHTQKTTELKPCPFCGGEAGIYKRILDWATWDYKIACSKCRCETDIYDTKWNAIEAWNKRVSEEEG